MRQNKYLRRFKFKYFYEVGFGGLFLRFMRFLYCVVFVIYICMNDPAQLKQQHYPTTCKINSLCKMLWGVWGALTTLFLSISLFAITEARMGQTQAQAVETKLEQVEQHAQSKLDIHCASQDQWQKNVIEKLDNIQNDLKEIKKQNK